MQGNRSRALTAMLALVGCSLTASPLSSQDSVPTWSVDQVARIGSMNDPNYALTEASQALIGPDLASYVARRMDKTIRVYGRSGQFLRTIGRAGKGPGEFDDLTYIGFKGDTFFTSDQSLHRVTLFDSGGGVVRSATVISPMLGDSMPELLLPNVPSILLPDDIVLVMGGVPVMWVERGGARMPYLRLDTESGQLDTLHWQPVPRYVFTVMHNGRRRSTLRPLPRDPQSTFAADGRGVVIVEMPVPASRAEASFRLQKIGNDGRPVFDRRIPYRPVPLPDSVFTQLLQESRDQLARAGDPPSLQAIEQALRSNDHVPDPLPPVTKLVASRDGRIWLQREWRGGPTVTWDVYDSRGQQIARLRLPSGEVVKDALGSELLTAGQDELGVPFIARYRIVSD